MNTAAGIIMLAMASGTSLGGGGADLICSEINSVVRYNDLDGYRAFSFGDVTCNIGDTAIMYDASTSAHPVFASTLYRILDGRIEQIGVGFVGHTFFPLQSNACGSCAPAAIGSLGAGCSDTITSGLSGSQSDLAPRSEINPYLADFPYPFTTIGQTGSSTYKRVKASVDDLSEQDALYFVEQQYLSVSETTDAAKNNNASYRRFEVQPNGNLSLVGVTESRRAAIYAWEDHGLGANTPDASVSIRGIQIPNDGIVHLASKAIDQGDGTWRYEYAVQNQNSARGIGSVHIRTAGNAPISTGFNGIEYLDAPDSDISSEDWAVSTVAGLTSWTTEDYASNMDANAIRWGTMYNFTLVSSAAPTTGSVELGLFAPGDEESVSTLAVVPSGTECTPDFTGDGEVDFFDISVFVTERIDYNHDTIFNFFDISEFLSDYVAGCP